MLLMGFLLGQQLVSSADTNRQSMLTPQISPPAENPGTFNTFVSLHFYSDVFTGDSFCWASLYVSLSNNKQRLAEHPASF